MPSSRSALDATTRQRLSEAHRARNRGKLRSAVALYKKVLLEHPHNVDVALRAAPLLAARGEVFEAWQLYRRASQALAKAGRWDDCLGVYREACRFVPHEFEAWRLCAELLIKLGRDDDAFEVLLDGRTRFAENHTRGQAIALLSRARHIEPWDPEVVLDLARLYARSDQGEAALELLQCLALRVDGTLLRRTRALQFRTTLSPRYAWLWIGTLGRRDRGESETYEALSAPGPTGLFGDDEDGALASVDLAAARRARERRRRAAATATPLRASG